MTATVRRVRPDEWARLRDVRLRALADAPDAFAEPYDRAAAMSDDHWRDRLTDASSVSVVAEDGDGAWVGLAGGYVLRDEPTVVRVVSVWTDPAWRGRGLGAALVDGVAAWAAEVGARDCQIETAPGNGGARRLYERLGFRRTDQTPPSGCDVVLRRPVPGFAP